MSWLVFALLSAVFAALTAILAKIGIKNVDSNVSIVIYEVFYLYLKLTTPSDQKSYLNDMLLGIVLYKQEIDVTNSKIKKSFEFRWTLNVRAKSILDEKRISSMLTFFDATPILTKSSLRQFANKCGISMSLFKRGPSKQKPLPESYKTQMDTYHRFMEEENAENTALGLPKGGTKYYKTQKRKNRKPKGRKTKNKQNKK